MWRSSLGDYATAEKAYREALGANRAAAAPSSASPRRSRVRARLAKRATRAERAAKAWANADANLPQMQKLRTSTAAIAQQ